ncbi:hypothetical protein L3Q65_00355 (plasmid) [Amycolatopsis sp. FU40]|uniref:hypothetical protein n=1 Tax=Amycolatopsis sp. FU40 TaxID=2914159 RepID=UPI001F475228|nr:hypothetical protein [Amycolatopsis sp. FU40]UKD50781.1 hypothetical protein L3Q65_00355 [Amycolatopsis sp. FU40]
MHATDVEVFCRSNPYDPGRTRHWEAVAVAAWLVQAALENVEAEPLPDPPPRPALHLVVSRGRRYALVAVDDNDSTEVAVRAIPEHQARNLDRQRQQTTGFAEDPPF